MPARMAVYGLGWGVYLLIVFAVIIVTTFWLGWKLRIWSDLFSTVFTPYCRALQWIPTFVLLIVAISLVFAPKITPDSVTPQVVCDL